MSQTDSKKTRKQRGAGPAGKKSGRAAKKAGGRKRRKRTAGAPVKGMPATQGLHRVEEPREMVLNSQVRDSGSKMIFDDNILCSQFLRDYIDLPYLKDVCPEDIEDVSEQYVTMFAQERNSDSVKRVHVGGGKPPFFLVSLIEHKTRPDYNVCMQVFRYMVYIWDSYEREAQKVQDGMAKREDFRYPPILPIVYYEGAGEWNVPRDFRSRIREGETFGKYIPNFEYYLVPLRDYSNEALMAKKDEISLIMLINKLQTEKDVEDFWRLPGGEIEAMLQDTPAHLLERIAQVLQAFLLKMNVPVPETEKLTDKVRKKKVAELFADMEKMDIQAERRKTENERRRAEEAEGRAKGAEGRADEAERRAEEAERRAKEAESQAEGQVKEIKTQAQKQMELAEEESVKSLIELCRELGTPRELAMRKLMDRKKLDREQAAQKMAKYWK